MNEPIALLSLLLTLTVSIMLAMWKYGSGRRDTATDDRFKALEVRIGKVDDHSVMFEALKGDMRVMMGKIEGVEHRMTEILGILAKKRR